MSEIVINSLASLDSALGQVRDRWFHSKYLRLVIRERKRSLSQNDQIHVWYEQIAVETGEYTALGAKNFSKLHYGVPILRAEDSDFRKFYDAAIRGLEYDQKIEAMDIVPVTSRMTVNQLNQYMAKMQDGWRGRGVILKFKDKQRAA